MNGRQLADAARRIRPDLKVLFTTGYVEDEVPMRMVATDQLEDLGYRVDTAGSATEAMNKVKLMEGDIALAIVDIGLPDIKGDVLVGELRLRHPDLPIIVASGYDDPALLKRFANDARVSFIRKPYTQDDLRRALPPLHER
jgi:CheY-like chemotaxis protein